MTQFIDKVTFNLPDRAYAVALAAHKSSSQQLSELTTDMRLRKAGDLDEGSHISRRLPELAEQLKPGGLTEQAKEVAVLLQKLRGRQGARGRHHNGL